MADLEAPAQEDTVDILAMELPTEDGEATVVAMEDLDMDQPLEAMEDMVAIADLADLLADTADTADTAEAMVDTEAMVAMVAMVDQEEVDTVATPTADQEEATADLFIHDDFYEVIKFD